MRNNKNQIKNLIERSNGEYLVKAGHRSANIDCLYAKNAITRCSDEYKTKMRHGSVDITSIYAKK